MTDSEVKNKIAVYPGTFDPITNGHIDIITRASYIFDKVIVSVADNKNKNPVFSIDERVGLIKQAIPALNKDNIEIDSFKGLLVDYLKEKQANIIIRGLRVFTDFDYEFAYASMNKKLAPDIETVLLMTSERFLFISSSIVKEVVRYGRNITDYAPDFVVNAIKDKFKD